MTRLTHHAIERFRERVSVTASEREIRRMLSSALPAERWLVTDFRKCPDIPGVRYTVSPCGRAVFVIRDDWGHPTVVSVYGATERKARRTRVLIRRGAIGGREGVTA